MFGIRANYIFADDLLALNQPETWYFGWCQLKFSLELLDNCPIRIKGLLTSSIFQTAWHDPKSKQSISDVR